MNRFYLLLSLLFLTLVSHITYGQIYRAEYYFNTDPGHGNGTAIAFTQSDTVSYIGSIQVPVSLPDGFHYLYIRTRDIDGKWSHAERRNFYVKTLIPPADPLKIIAAEFFIDTDPGVGNGTAIPVSPSDSAVNVNAIIQLPSFGNGTRKLCIRTQDSNGIWSLQEIRTFAGITTPDVTISPVGPIPNCNGTGVTLTADTTNGPWTFKWYFNSVLIPGATSRTFNAVQPGQYTVQITSGGDSQTATVTLLPPPALSSTPVSPICPGVPIQLSLNFPLQSGAWSTGDTLQSITVYAQSDTSFSVAGIDTNGCSINLSVSIDTLDAPLVGTSIPVLPVDGDNGVMTPVTLSWSPSLNSSAYEVFLWPSSASRPENGALNGLTLTKTYTSLLPYQEYFWQVRSSNVCNAVFSDTAVFTTNFPDLIVDSVAVPPLVYTGTSIPVLWKVKNNAATANTGSRTWRDRIWISLDTIPGNGADVLLGMYTNQSYLNAGTSYIQQRAITIGNSFNGLYYIIAQTDALQELSEGVESNNYHFDSIVIQPAPVPDLKVLTLANPGNAFSGDSITVTYTIENDGQIPTDTVQWRDEIFISSSPTFNSSALSLGTFNSYNFNLIPVYYFHPDSGNYIHHYDPQVYPLKEDSTYLAQTRVRIPTTLNSGNYYIFVKTNTYGEVDEGPYAGNNTTQSSVTLQLTQLPPSDLVVDTVITALNAGSGLPLSVSWTVRNQGAAVTMLSSWTDKIYINTAPTLTGATLVGSRLRQGALTVGSTYTASMSVKLPNGISGAYYVMVNTDDPDNIYEFIYENNNLDSAAHLVTVALSPSPDVIISSLNIVNDTMVVSTQTDILYTIRNNGNAATQGVYKTFLYVSDQPQNGTFYAKIAEAIESVVLQPGDSIQRNLRFSAYGAVGNYFYFLTTDANNNFYEHNAENNNTSGPDSLVSVSPLLTFSDLDVINSSLPATVFTGVGYPITYQVINNGPDASYTSQWLDRVYLSSDAIPDASDDKVFERIHGGTLSTSQFYTVNGTALIPNGKPSGTYYLIVETDALNANINETLNANNIHAEQISLTLTSPPDLEVIDVDVKDTVFANEITWLYYTVRNNGPGSFNQTLIADRVYFGNTPVAVISSSGGISRNRALAAGATYSDSIQIAIPSYAFGYSYLNVATDRLNAVYENPNEGNNIGSKVVYASQFSNIDLSAVSLTFPKDSFLLGESTTINYSITNTGTRALSATNRDAISLSVDSAYDGAFDYLLVEKEERFILQPGDTLQRTLNTTIRDALPDWYNGVLRTNTTRTYPDDNFLNNLLFSDSIFVDAEELFVDVPDTSVLWYGTDQYYKVTVPAGQDMMVTLKSLNGTGQNSIQASHAVIPTAAASDYFISDAAEQDQRLLIPGTMAGTYYLLVRNYVPAPDSQQVEIKVELLPLTILSINTNEGGQDIVTTTLKGASFRDTSVVQLRQGAVSFASATIIDYVHSMQMELRWDLNDVPLGVYDVLIRNGEDSAMLAGGFTVEKSESMKPGLSVFRSGSFVMGTPFTIGCTFTNISNIDIPVVQANVMLSDDCPITVYDGPDFILLKEVMAGYDDSLNTFDNRNGYNIVSGYITDLKPGETVSLRLESRVRGDKDQPIGFHVAAKGMTRLGFARRNYFEYEEVREIVNEFGLDSSPQMMIFSLEKNLFHTALMGPYIDRNITTLADVQEVLDDTNYVFVDFDPGEEVGKLVDGNLTLKGEDVYKWEINVPETTLGAAPGNTIGWDFIHSTGSIDISANASKQFIIIPVPRNPCDNAFSNLTTWEAWHDYKWPIAYAENGITGFSPDAFEVDVEFFEQANNLYGGTFEVSTSGDTLYLEFIHRVPVCGDLAVNGGPGLCGYPGGDGGPGVCNGAGGDGGPGWGANSGGGNGGNGGGGGGSGGSSGGGTPGTPGTDTDPDGDGDGANDASDNCDNVFNPGQADTDGDGIGDACDNNPTQPDPDNDGDGVPEASDNCPGVSNRSQADTDGDGIGDACDSEDDRDTPDCIALGTCPQPPGCPDSPYCSPDNPPDPGGPPTTPQEPTAQDVCDKILKDLGCLTSIKGCMETALETIALLGGSLDPRTTVGAANLRILATAVGTCTLDLLEGCFDINVDIPGGPCLRALKGLGKSLSVLSTSVNEASGVLGAARSALDDCAGIGFDEQEILCLGITKFLPVDPNEIKGPMGAGDTSIRWVSKYQPMNFSIFFENDSVLASAPASRVMVTQDLHPNMDPLSFRLGSVNFGSYSFPLPSLANYSGVLNLNDTLGFDVEVTAGLDIVQNRLFWILQTVDPLTGLPPNTINGGFLPPNDTLSNGQGYVTYTIAAAGVVVSSDTATATAEIVFDINDPIITNTWINTFDAGYPASSMDSIPPFILNDSLEIIVHTSDDTSGSGVEFVSLYMQAEGSGFTHYASVQQEDTIRFPGIDGTEYGFYTIAVDSTGNRELPKTSAQYVTHFGYPDSLKFITPPSFSSYCTGDTVFIQWAALRSDSIRIIVHEPSADTLLNSPWISSADSQYAWVVPVVPAGDTLILTIQDKDDADLLDRDTILLLNASTWYLDNDNDGYYSGLPVVSCQSPGAMYTTTITGGDDCDDASATTYPTALELCNVTDDNCNGNVDEGCPNSINLRIYIEGLYIGNGNLMPVLHYNGVTANPLISDSVIVELRDATSPYSLLQSETLLLNVSGEVTAHFPVPMIGTPVYVVIKHRNSIETWSKVPVVLGPNTIIDFRY
ncbi:MAG: thrombospondin type 3 repeat-containing protein [Bacteroidetes bacterium]|nr:thrombospondin type 3 repeat-containing protein [Bacteroidota bacterium]